MTTCAPAGENWFDQCSCPKTTRTKWRRKQDLGIKKKCLYQLYPPYIYISSEFGWYVGRCWDYLGLQEPSSGHATRLGWLVAPHWWVWNQALLGSPLKGQQPPCQHQPREEPLPPLDMGRRSTVSWKWWRNHADLHWSCVRQPET